MITSQGGMQDMLPLFLMFWSFLLPMELKRKTDLSATRNTKKAKSALQPSVQSIESNQQKITPLPNLSRRRTRFSNKLLGTASKSDSHKAVEHITLKDDIESSSLLKVFRRAIQKLDLMTIFTCFRKHH